MAELIGELEALDQPVANLLVGRLALRRIQGRRSV
jgi:hypothetical protein